MKYKFEYQNQMLKIFKKAKIKFLKYKIIHLQIKLGLSHLNNISIAFYLFLF